MKLSKIIKNLIDSKEAEMDFEMAQLGAEQIAELEEREMERLKEEAEHITEEEYYRG